MNEEVIQILRDCFHERPSVLNDVQITGDTEPERDLGIDSLEGIEITCELSKKLGIAIPEKENLLVAKDADGRRRMRKVSEIAARLLELTTQNEEAK